MILLKIIYKDKFINVDTHHTIGKFIVDNKYMRHQNVNGRYVRKIEYEFFNKYYL